MSELKTMKFLVVVDRLYAFVKSKTEVSTKKDFIANAGIKLLFHCYLADFIVQFIFTAFVLTATLQRSQIVIFNNSISAINGKNQSTKGQNQATYHYYGHIAL